MTSPGSIGNQAPRNWDDLGRQVKQLRREVAQLLTARSLESAMIGKGGLSVGGTGKIAINPGGTSVELRTDTFDGVPSAAVAFLSSDPTAGQSFVRLLDEGPGSVLLAQSNTDADGYQSRVGLAGSGGLTATHLDSDGSSIPSAQLYLLGKLTPRFEATVSDGTNTGDVSVTPTRMTVYVGAAKSLQFDGAAVSVNYLQWVNSSDTEWQAQNGSAAYVPVRASSFPTSSSAAVKEDLSDLPFDPVQAISDANAFAWRYRPEHSADQRTHFGPVAEDLPPAAVDTSGDTASVDVRDLVGILWGAVNQLADRVDFFERNTLEMTMQPKFMREAVALAKWNERHGAILHDVTIASGGFEDACVAYSDDPSPDNLDRVRKSATEIDRVCARAQRGPFSGVHWCDQPRRVALRLYRQAAQAAATWEPGTPVDVMAAPLARGTELLRQVTTDTRQLNERAKEWIAGTAR